MTTALQHLRTAGLYDGPDRDSVMIPCPFAKWFHGSGADSKPSMKIDVYETTVSFYCFGCKTHGPLWMLFNLLYQLTKDKDYLKQADEVREDLEPTVEKRLLHASEKLYSADSRPKLPGQAFQNWWGSFPDLYNERPNRVKEFLQGRGVSEDTCVWCDLKYDHMSDRLMFPVYRGFHCDELVSVVGRELSDKQPPYFVYWKTHSTDFLGCGRIQKPETCRAFLVVEGFMDLLRTISNLQVLELDDVFFPVCTFTSMLSEHQAGLIEFEQIPVYCMYDADKAGDQGWYGRTNEATGHRAGGMVKVLKGKVPRLQRLRPPEGKDPGDLSPAGLGEILEKVM